MYKHKFLFFIFVLFITTFIWDYGSVDVKAESVHKLTGSVSSGQDKKSSVSFETNNWVEDILTIGGSKAYCIDYNKTFKGGKSFASMDSVDYLTEKTGMNRDDAQEIITTLALYNDYLSKREGLSQEVQYYFGQILVWRELNTIYKWTDGYIGITYDEKHSNMYIVKDKEEAIYEGAKKYANKNKTKYKGKGTTWYDDDSSDGTNQPLIELFLERIGYDYSIDAACNNCSSTNKNGAYLIQDTNDWEAIFASTKFSENSNLKNYYKKDVGDSSCNVYCREEYKVIYPNANNYNGKEAMNIEPGRYFTINQKSSGSMYKAGVFNFAPIKVVKTMQCKDSKNNQTCLNKVTDSNDTGEIEFKYVENETKEKNNYGTKGKLKVNKSRTITNKTINDNMLTSTTTKYYELPDNLYRYVDSSGKSYKETPTDDLKKYRDMGIPNLPVSFKNYNATLQVTLTYSLPSGSKISKAFKDDEYFGTNNNKESNLYKLDSENDLDDREKELIKLSSCAKLYGYGSDEYKTCRNDRKENKTKACRDSSSKGKTNSYTCELKTCSEDGCDNPKCAIVGDKYYDDTGTETTKEDYEKKCPECRIDGNKYYGKNGTEISKEEYYAECPLTCRIVISENKDVYYYDATGASVSYDVYKKTCDDTCSSCNGGICCPDTDMVCPDENGNCPSRGGRKIIYRTIDLDNPFPYIDGDGRKTGANWCSYNIYTKKITCVNTIDNPIVSKHIINNRGIASKTIYTLVNNDDNNSLYTVTLNGETIKNIKNYNKSHEYDDNSLICDKEGSCRSDFLRNEVTINGGRCANGGYDNLKTCAEES